jgi:hypothetical protein
MPSLKSTSTDALASAARQLNYALQESPNLDDAFKKLYATADERRRITLKQLEGLLRSAQPDNAEGETVRSSPYPTLKWILSLAPTPERSAAAVFQEFRRQESFSASSVAVVWSEFAGFLTYLGAVLGILIVVVAMYAVFMLPQFRSLYGGFGRELPGLTQFAFGGGGSVFTVLLFGSLLLLIFLAWFVHALRRRLRRYTPVPVRFQKVPLVGPVALAYNQYLWLSCARLLTVAGVPATQALRLAAQRSNNAAAGVPDPDKLIGNYVTRVEVVQGAINVTFGNFANKQLEGQIVTLQPIVVKGSPASPMSWRCGYHEVPKGMEPVGENRTNLDRRYLPTSCRSLT